jgi:hypothetical protein
MSKPFQFSIRQMFALVTLFCVAVWLFVTVSASGLFSGPGSAAAVALGATFGCAIGLFTGAPKATALFGAVLVATVLGMIWAMLMEGLSHMGGYFQTPSLPPARPACYGGPSRRIMRRWKPCRKKPISQNALFNSACGR